MKKLLYLVIGLFAFVACQENERQIYDTINRIYFNRTGTAADSVTVSLFAKPNSYIHKVAVKLVGQLPTEAKSYRVEVDTKLTTAKEGVHYKALESIYTFPAGKNLDSVQIVLYNTDTEMANKHFILALRLVPTEDIELAYEARTSIRIRISTIIKAPEGSDLETFIDLFGDYSKVKHALIIDMTGHDFWDGDYGEYGGKEGLYFEIEYYTPYSRALYQYVTNNEVYDESGKLIEPWF